MRARRRFRFTFGVLGIALSATVGCQTWVPTTGQTLPSPRYLDHPPQYIPPSPFFPLSREQATLEAQWAVPPGAGPIAPPRPVGQ